MSKGPSSSSSSPSCDRDECDRNLSLAAKVGFSKRVNYLSMVLQVTLAGQ